MHTLLSFAFSLLYLKAKASYSPEFRWLRGVEVTCFRGSIRQRSAHDHDFASLLLCAVLYLRHLPSTKSEQHVVVIKGRRFNQVIDGLAFVGNTVGSSLSIEIWTFPRLFGPLEEASKAPCPHPSTTRLSAKYLCSSSSWSSSD